ncbi:threonine/serine exporter family protein [Kribbella jiaozuonensis]|uniref:Threonine/serine exporter family protein n=1 Tax=Kribbella jiaozuonensis TaxID=2575441 RepID=A0A4U3M2N8_9ACTN|nr:threonine/serine exporter family protein [Kribbella jiaozuonensis]TKK83008.1 threonine/serine exporter family protein [Kribbella jiaozuonensis]
MTERREVYETLDLALRIGEVLLSSGAGAADVTVAMLAVTRACGVSHVTADVTFVNLTLRHQPTRDEPAAIQVRRVTRRPVDYAHLIEVDETLTSLVAGDISRAEARDQVARIVSTGHHRRRWAVTFGWGVMGIGIALTLGGGPLVCLLAFLAACAIDGTQLLLPLHRIPAFYQQAAGGFVATLVAVIASATELEVDPSRVVTAGIVMLLAGVGIMGATQDALTGFPVTASARLIDAVLNTAGIIAGVGAGLTVGDLLGVGLTTFTPGAAGPAEVGVTVLGAALAAAAFAFASYSPRRSLIAVALVAALGQGFCWLSTGPRSAGLGGRRSLPSPSVRSATSLPGVSGSRRSASWFPRSCRSCRDSTSTGGSLSSRKARTAPSSWPPRSPRRWRSRPV